MGQTAKKPAKAFARAVLYTRRAVAGVLAAAFMGALAEPALNMLDNGEGHPVFEWIRSNYKPVEPAIPEEREFFTFYVPVTAPLEFLQRVLGSGAESIPD